jgi:hypothetical protein
LEIGVVDTSTGCRLNSVAWVFDLDLNLNLVADLMAVLGNLNFEIGCSFVEYSSSGRDVRVIEMDCLLESLE